MFCLFDRIVICGLAAIIIIAPLLLGAVEPWGYTAAETAIFAISAVALLKWILSSSTDTSLQLSWPQSGSLLIPAALFAALVALQILPLPPATERLIAPHTFELYQRALPGWPSGRLSRVPVSDLADRPGAPSATASIAVAREPALRDQSSASWRPLALAPRSTWTALLKLLAYLSLLLLVVSYSPSSGDRRFAPRLFGAIIAAGILVAILAIVSRIFPNGKVLWLFTPYDWGSSNPWGPRAVGPFANPDHLADFLDLALPPAIAGFLIPSAFGSRNQYPMRQVCAAAAILIASALLMTSSRGGIAGAFIGLAVMVWLVRRLGIGGEVYTFGRVSIGLDVAAALLVVLLMAGPEGRAQADIRLKQTAAADSFAGRLAPAAASLRIAGDFPLFGVGLGGWPEIVSHYRKPPWSPVFWNAAHNDYLQLLSETGLLGTGLAAWFMLAALSRIRRGLPRLGSAEGAIAAGCIGGISAAAVHELFDFPLQIPANAIMFVVLLGIALLLTAGKSSASASASFIPTYLVPGPRLLAALGLLTIGGLILAAVRQESIPYPYNLNPTTPARANELADHYPANARLHLRLLALLGDKLSLQSQADQLRAALWLEPANPTARDLYAVHLMRTNRNDAAYHQLTQSVANAPALDHHFYLAPAAIPRLTHKERDAIADGFRDAIACGYPQAAENFADYYETLGDFAARGAVLQSAANATDDPAERAKYLDQAGLAYAQAGDRNRAETIFRAALAAQPDSSAAYEDLIERVFAPAGNFVAARALAAQGIARGADPRTLDLALATAAEAAGKLDDAEASMMQAIALAPGDYTTVMRLGEFELRHQRFGRAANWLQRATELEPDSADAFNNLGRADEAAYDYFAADRAYQRALRLAPSDSALRAHYAAFRDKLTRNEAAPPLAP